MTSLRAAFTVAAPVVIVRVELHGGGSDECLVSTMNRGGGGLAFKMTSLEGDDPASKTLNLIRGGPLPWFEAKRAEDLRCIKTSPGSVVMAGLFVGDGEAPAEDGMASDSEVKPYTSSSDEADSYGSRRERQSSEDVDVLEGFDFVFPGAKPSYQLSDLLDMAGQESDGSPKDDEPSLRPTDATWVLSSRYCGDAELGGSHGAELTLLHNGQGRTRPLFSWLHVQQQVMNFDDFWTEISHRVRFSEDEKKATAKLCADVKNHAIKTRHNERGDTVGLMEPRYFQVPLKPSGQQAVRWINLPFFSLQPCSGLLSASSPASFPPQTLLQTHYSRTPAQRDLKQALWCLVVDNSLLVTCASMTQSDLCSSGSLKLISQPPQRDPGSAGSGRILVAYGNAVLWVLRVRDCPTWFSFISRFNAFWPKSVEFRWRDRVVDPNSWPKMLHLASLPRASVLLKLHIIKTPPRTEAPSTEQQAREQQPEDLHVFTLRPGDSTAASESADEALRTQLAKAEKFLLRNASFAQRQAYRSCVGALRREVLDGLVGEGSAVEVEGDDSMRASHEVRLDLFHSCETIFQLYLPRDFDGPTTDKFWGSVKAMNTDITTKPSDRSYQHRIDLIRQELTIISQTLTSQSLLISDIRTSLPYEPSSSEDLPRRRPDMMLTRTLRRSTTRARAAISTRAVRAMLPTDLMPVAELRPDELAAASRLAPTDQLGFRDLLLAECGRGVEARELELVRLGDYAEELENDVVFRMGSTKDRQEKAIYAFTLVTIIFLPISAISSIFGMNTSDIRNMAADQWLYWAVAMPVTIVVILVGLWWINEFGGGGPSSGGGGPPVAESRERVYRSPESRVRRRRTRRRTRTF
ncbi:hypothetical protein CDD80_4454 [Ophiocordyceps camponoti-rufipedis]|uniref:Uncharacterized protein n=1 Tax=Ophiocordyceps camponoti-rufipedis TaxID=2004952 RepID=A0A2C5ZJH6_9HYPO|nr:hypothetical protein CDD80_4454 [Ophiocordyceps camponoti-rufipedis]